MFLHYLTLHKNGIVMFSSSEYCEWFCFGVSEVALSWLCGTITVGVRSYVPLPLHMHASMFATGLLL